MIAAGRPIELSLNLLLTMILFAGTGLLVVYVGARIRGRELLPVGPSPATWVRVLDAVLLAFASYFVQMFTLGLITPPDTKPTLLLIVASYVGPVLIAASVLVTGIVRGGDPGRKLPGVGAGLLAWLATFPVVAAVLFAWTGLLKEAGANVEQQDILTSLRGNWVIFFVIAVVLAPFVEEVVFRGLIYPAIRGKAGKATGMIVSAALFGLVHWHLPTFPAIFVLGLALAYVYEKTGTILAPIAFHAMFNGWTFLGELMS